MIITTVYFGGTLSAGRTIGVAIITSLVVIGLAKTFIQLLNNPNSVPRFIAFNALIAIDITLIALFIVRFTVEKSYD